VNILVWPTYFVLNNLKSIFTWTYLQFFTSFYMDESNDGRIKSTSHIQMLSINNNKAFPVKLVGVLLGPSTNRRPFFLSSITFYAFSVLSMTRPSLYNPLWYHQQFPDRPLYLNFKEPPQNFHGSTILTGSAPLQYNHDWIYNYH